MRIIYWSSDCCSSDLRPSCPDVAAKNPFVLRRGLSLAKAPSRRTSSQRPSRRHFDKLNGSSGQTVVGTHVLRTNTVPAEYPAPNEQISPVSPATISSWFK